MKIIKEDAAYVQKIDLANLSDFDGPMPTTVFMKLFSREASIIEDTDAEQFVRFDSKNEVEFFKKADWILDYDFYNAKDADELYSFAEEMIEEINNLTIEYNELSGEEQCKNGMKIKQMNLLIYEIQSLRSLIIKKRGTTEVKFSELLPIKDKASKYRNKQLNIKIGNMIIEETKNTFKEVFGWLRPKKSKKMRKTIDI
jgi:hypothetical protein